MDGVIFWICGWLAGLVGTWLAGWFGG